MASVNSPTMVSPVSSPSDSSELTHAQRMQVLANGDIVDCARLPSSARNTLYKTELCKHFMETGTCRYSNKCQFAHGHDELRGVLRHPKYKTTKCKAFSTTGNCVYGSRCRFIHEKPNGQIVSGSGSEDSFQQSDENLFEGSENNTPETAEFGSIQSIDAFHASFNQLQKHEEVSQYKSLSNNQYIDLSQPFGSFKPVNLTPLTSLNSSNSSSIDSNIFRESGNDRMHCNNVPYVEQCKSNPRKDSPNPASPDNQESIDNQFSRLSIFQNICKPINPNGYY